MNKSADAHTMHFVHDHIPTESKREPALTGRSLLTFIGPISEARFIELVVDLQRARARSFTDRDRASFFFSKYGSARVPVPPELIGPELRAEYDIVSVDPEREVGILHVPTDGEFRLNALAEMKVMPNLRWTGAGIKVAVLDSGFECNHPDFVGRSITRESCVRNYNSFDQNGHGTHCAGLIAGPRQSYRTRPGYGVAPDIDLIVIRALRDTLVGDDGDILKAMNLADDLEADIIVMCMSADIAPVAAFEKDAAAMKDKRLIIAAAGNDTSTTEVAEIGNPANVPSIMGVAAINDRRRPWEFSAGSGRSDVVEVAAPGEGIFSSYLSSIKSHDRVSGTSQAAAYAAGVAALWAHSDPKYRGEALRDILKERALDLGDPDLLGCGLVQAPLNTKKK